MMRALGTALSALDAFSVAQAVGANNIANVSTEEFDPSVVRFEERPDMGGVAVSEVRETEVQAPLVPMAGPYAVSDGGSVQTAGYVEASGTDVAVEMVHMISNQRAFEANAAVVRTQDEMVGSLLNELV